MKIEAGMYVRTKNGLIAKCISVNNYIKKYVFDDNVSWEYEYYEEVYFDSWEEFVSENLKKYSFELIDLIEAGDYVNGRKVDDISLIEDVYFVKIKVSNTNNYDYLPEHLIEDIVTKEQFNLVKYHKKRAE